MAIATPIQTRPVQMSEAEREARVNLAALYRLADHYGWHDLIYNHLAARVPGERFMLMKQSNLMFDEVCASNLAKLDLDGPTPGFEKNVNPAGFTIHSSVINARPEVNYTLHIHTRAGSAVSATRTGVLPISQDSMRFFNRVSYHDFEGPAVDGGEAVRLAKDLGPRNRSMILRNHGLLTCGASPAVALSEIRYLVEACETQLMLQASGAEMSLPPAEICEKTAQLLEHFTEKMNGAEEWRAYLRIADRLDPSFRG
jgi:ribulose-5-phosphate 4-epimerase/fuculose-1-phosphate aldolase